MLLGERGRALWRPATLDDIPDDVLDRIAGQGFAWVWLLGVWTTGPKARAVSRGRREWKEAFTRALPDLRDEDILGSPFAVLAYETAPEHGGDVALDRLRHRLNRRGLGLVLDFVPNHMSLDHPWTVVHPEWLIEGTPEDLRREPPNWFQPGPEGGRILAHGRDPHFPGWPDTVQLNHLHPGLREALLEELSRVSERCDGVRCDMAMLVLPEVFRRTWGEQAAPRDGSPPVEGSFWEEATARVRPAHPEFLFMAEAYWGLERSLQEQGFDFTYDKHLYDRLAAGDARAVRTHLLADPDYQERSARFVENHDEPRAATALGPERSRAAAVISFLAPGLRLFHDGQMDGRAVHVPVHLGRRPEEPRDADMSAFYGRLLRVLGRQEVHDGHWRLAECRAAWDGNPTWDRFVCMGWEGRDEALLFVAVNYGPTRGQCYARLPFEAGKGTLALRDLLGEAWYERDGAELNRRGLYLDLPPWGLHVFEVTQVSLTGAGEDS